MRKLLLVAIPVIGALCMFGKAPSQTATSKAKTLPGNVTAGREAFVKSCMACHSTNEGQVLFGPSLYHESTGPHPKKTPAEIRTILKEGKGKMPAFQDKLQEEQINDLIAYIRSL